MYDIIIIGAGPAGMAAGVIASKNKLKTLVLAKEFSLPEESANELLSASDLKKQFEKEVKEKIKYLEFQNNQEVLSLEKNVVSFAVETKSGREYYAKTVIICSGQDPKTREGNSSFDLRTFKNSVGKIKVDRDMQTNVPGIFAAGSVTESVKNNSFSGMGEGAKAVLSILAFLAN